MNEQKIAALVSVEELQKQGSVETLRLKIEKIIAPLKVEASSYEDLWKIIESLQTHWAPCMKGPFVSRRKELLHALNTLEGKNRSQALGITQEHYEDLAKAKALFRSLRQQITDKTGRDLEAEAAFKTLTEIFYNVMDVQEGTDLEGDDDHTW